MLRRRTKRAIYGLSIVLMTIAAVGLFVMLLWNALIPDLFNGPTLNYWQAVGVLLLSHLLLRGTPLYGWIAFSEHRALWAGPDLPRFLRACRLSVLK